MNLTSILKANALSFFIIAGGILTIIHSRDVSKQHASERSEEIKKKKREKNNFGIISSSCIADFQLSIFSSKMKKFN